MAAEAENREVRDRHEELTREQLQHEVDVLNEKLETANRTIEKFTKQMEMQTNRTKQLIAAWKLRLDEGEQKLAQQTKDRDNEMKEIISNLMFLEGNLRKEQQTITKRLTDKDKTIERQEKRINKLNSANTKLVEALNKMRNSHFNHVFANGVNGSVEKTNDGPQTDIYEPVPKSRTPSPTTSTNSGDNNNDIDTSTSTSKPRMPSPITPNCADNGISSTSTPKPRTPSPITNYTDNGNSSVWTPTTPRTPSPTSENGNSSDSSTTSKSRTPSPTTPNRVRFKDDMVDVYEDKSRNVIVKRTRTPIPPEAFRHMRANTISYF